MMGWGWLPGGRETGRVDRETAERRRNSKDGVEREYQRKLDYWNHPPTWPSLHDAPYCAPPGKALINSSSQNHGSASTYTVSCSNCGWTETTTYYDDPMDKASYG